MTGMVKMTGMVLMVASCSGLGFQLAELLTDRMDQCLGIRQCLQRLLGEIRFHQLTLPEALRATGQAMEGEAFSSFLLQVAVRLEKEGDFPLLWKQELDVFEKKSLLGGEIRWLSRLGPELGTLDLEAQIRSLEQCIGQWQEEMDTLKQQAETYRRLYRGMGMCAGIFLALILW